MNIATLVHRTRKKQFIFFKNEYRKNKYKYIKIDAKMADFVFLLELQEDSDASAHQDFWVKMFLKVNLN